jgi:hypothetical protein
MSHRFSLLVAFLIGVSFSPEVRSQSLLQTISQTNLVGVNIPDPGQYSSSVMLDPGSLFDQITQVRVNLVLSSPIASQPMWLGQIKANLLYGTGTEVQRAAVVLDRLGVTGSDPFGSSATSLNQTFDLGTAFNGSLLASNLWTLTVADMQSGATARFDSWTLEVSGVPEPSSASLLILGLAAVLARRRRCRRSAV